MADIQIPWSGWETVGQIGRGGFGSVYEIRRDLFGNEERAALKVISIPQNDNDITELYNEGYSKENIIQTYSYHLQKLVNEYSLMRKMSGCANIVSCENVEYVQHEDGIGWDIFIKMELLTPLIRAVPIQCSDETVIQVAIDLCSALEVCKQHGIVHRDIKPQNILASGNGVYKLGDFGIARTMEQTTGATRIGTYKYMAPEVYNNQPYGTGADLYSLGLTLYWLLNERRMPFLPLPPANVTFTDEEQAKARRFSGEPLPPPAHGCPELQNIVLKACAYRPEDRYQSAAQMKAELEALSLLFSDPTRTLPFPIQKHNVVQPGLEDLSLIEKVVNADNSASASKKDPRRKYCRNCGAELPLNAISCQICHSTVSAIVTAPPAPQKDRKALRVVVLITAAICLLLLLLLGIRRCSRSDWSEWTTDLPQKISEEDYVIEEQILYRSRELETCTSTDSIMPGWELYDTQERIVSAGEWSAWSENKPAGTLDREEATMYRYRDKEYTTSNSSTMPGWTLDQSATTNEPGDYGAWSDWSTTAVSSGSNRKVETKDQYRYRSISYSTEYTGWGAWSSWSTTRQSTSNLKKEDSRTVWAYYYFLCPGCGAHMHGWGITCPTWAGGCGKTYIPENSWHAVYSTTSWDNAGLKNWYGTGKYYANIDGQILFKHTSGGSTTQYRYATRSTYTATNYGNWSGWSDTYYSGSSTREVQTRKLYRYCERIQSNTYRFWRWAEWSDWSDSKPAQVTDREVETKTLYRSREAKKETVYSFRRWTAWSEYQIEPILESDTTQVDTRTQYRYKRK